MVTIMIAKLIVVFAVMFSMFNSGGLLFDRNATEIRMDTARLQAVEASVDSALVSYYFATGALPDTLDTDFIRNAKITEDDVKGITYKKTSSTSFTVTAKNEKGTDVLSPRSNSTLPSLTTSDYNGDQKAIRYAYLSVPETPNQTVTYKVTTPSTKEYTGGTFTVNEGETKKFVCGSSFVGTVVPDQGFTAGTLSPASGTLDKDIAIIIDDPVPETVTLTFPATVNQTASFTIFDSLTKQDTTITTGDAEQKVTITKGSYLKDSSVIADEGYTAGVISAASLSNLSNIVSDVSVAITNSVLQTRTLAVADQEGVTISNVKVYDYNDGNTYTLASGDSRAVGYWSTWGDKTYSGAVVPTITLDKAYNLSNAALNATGGTIKTDTVVSVNGVEVNTYTFTIPATQNQVIMYTIVNRDGTIYSGSNEYQAKSFTLGHGATYTLEVIADEGFIPGSLSTTSGIVTGNTNITINPSSAQREAKTITIGKTENQIITVYYTDIDNGAGSVSSNSSSDVSFNVGYGSIITNVVVTPVNNWFTAGTATGYTLNAAIKNNVTITAASEAVRKKGEIAVEDVEGQTLYVNVHDIESNTDMTLTNGQSATVGYGSTWAGSSVKHVAGSGFADGAFVVQSGVFESELYTVTATSPVWPSYTLSVANPADETITVSYKNADTLADGTLTNGDSIKLPNGSTWTATVKADNTTKHLPGTLSATSGTLSGANQTVSATAVTLQKYNLTLPYDQYQRITVSYQCPDGSTGTEINNNSINASKSIVLPYGTTWSASVSSLNPTIISAGSVSPSSGIITGNQAINFISTGVRHWLVSVGNCDTATLTVKFSNGSTCSNGQSIYVDNGTTYTTSVNCNTGYEVSSISSSSGTITSDQFFSVTTQKKTYTVSVASTSNQTITVSFSNGKTLTNGQSASIPYGTTWTASVSPASGYTAGTLSPGTSGTVTGTLSISATEALQKSKYRTIYIFKRDIHNYNSSSLITIEDTFTTNNSSAYLYIYMQGDFHSDDNYAEYADCDISMTNVSDNTYSTLRVNRAAEHETLVPDAVGDSVGYSVALLKSSPNTTYSFTASAYGSVGGITASGTLTIFIFEVFPDEYKLYDNGTKADGVIKAQYNPYASDTLKYFSNKDEDMLFEITGESWHNIEDFDRDILVPVNTL